MTGPLVAQCASREEVLIVLAEVKRVFADDMADSQPKIVVETNWWSGVETLVIWHGGPTDWAKTFEFTQEPIWCEPMSDTILSVYGAKRTVSA